MRRVSIIFLAIIFAGILTSSCDNNITSTNAKKEGVSTFDITEMKKIIIKKNSEFTKAHITRDTTFLNNIFTQDAKVFPPNSDVVNGRAAIGVLNSEWVNYGIEEFTEETTGFYGNEDYLFDEGTYFLRYGKNNIIDEGKYINIWKKEDGEWKIFRNIWNTNLPITTSK